MSDQRWDSTANPIPQVSNVFYINRMADESVIIRFGFVPPGSQNVVPHVVASVALTGKQCRRPCEIARWIFGSRKSRQLGVFCCAPTNLVSHDSNGGCTDGDLVPLSRVSEEGVAAGERAPKNVPTTLSELQ